MDFFQSQDNARRNTKLLLGLYAAAVISIIVLTNILLIAVTVFFDSSALSTGTLRYDWETFLIVSLMVVIVRPGQSLSHPFLIKRGGSSGRNA